MRSQDFRTLLVEQLQSRELLASDLVDIGQVVLIDEDFTSPSSIDRFTPAANVGFSVVNGELVNLTSTTASLSMPLTIEHVTTFEVTLLEGSDARFEQWLTFKQETGEQYTLIIQRSGAHYSNANVQSIPSKVGNSIVNRITSPFQFDDQLRLTLTLHPDGQIEGTLQGQDGQVMTFEESHPSLAQTTSVQLNASPEDRRRPNRKPGFDNLLITKNLPAPVEAAPQTATTQNTVLIDEAFADLSALDQFSNVPSTPTFIVQNGELVNPHNALASLRLPLTITARTTLHVDLLEGSNGRFEHWLNIHQDNGDQFLIIIQRSGSHWSNTNLQLFSFVNGQSQHQEFTPTFQIDNTADLQLELNPDGTIVGTLGNEQNQDFTFTSHHASLAQTNALQLNASQEDVSRPHRKPGYDNLKIIKKIFAYTSEQPEQDVADDLPPTVDGSFNTNVLDTSIWKIVNNSESWQRGVGTRINSGHLLLEGNYLTTVGDYRPSIEHPVGISFTVNAQLKNDSINELIRVATRTDGTPNASDSSGALLNGIEAVAKIRRKGATSYSYLEIREIKDGQLVKQSRTTLDIIDSELLYGTDLAVNVRDDGRRVVFEVGNNSVTLDTNFEGEHNKIAIYNRRHGIDQPVHTAMLDDVTIGHNIERKDLNVSSEKAPSELPFALLRDYQVIGRPMLPDHANAKEEDGEYWIDELERQSDQQVSLSQIGHHANLELNLLRTQLDAVEEALTAAESAFRTSWTEHIRHGLIDSFQHGVDHYETVYRERQTEFVRLQKQIDTFEAAYDGLKAEIKVTETYRQLINEFLQDSGINYVSQTTLVVNPTLRVLEIYNHAIFVHAQHPEAKEIVIGFSNQHANVFRSRTFDNVDSDLGRVIDLYFDVDARPGTYTIEMRAGEKVLDALQLSWDGSALQPIKASDSFDPREMVNAAEAALLISLDSDDLGLKVDQEFTREAIITGVEVVAASVAEGKYEVSPTTPNVSFLRQHLYLDIAKEVGFELSIEDAKELYFSGFPLHHPDRFGEWVESEASRRRITEERYGSKLLPEIARLENSLRTRYREDMNQLVREVGDYNDFLFSYSPEHALQAVDRILAGVSEAEAIARYEHMIPEHHNYLPLLNSIGFRSHSEDQLWQATTSVVFSPEGRRAFEWAWNEQRELEEKAQELVIRDAHKVFADAQQRTERARGFNVERITYEEAKARQNEFAEQNAQYIQSARNPQFSEEQEQRSIQRVQRLLQSIVGNDQAITVIDLDQDSANIESTAQEVEILSDTIAVSTDILTTFDENLLNAATSRLEFFSNGETIDISDLQFVFANSLLNSDPHGNEFKDELLTYESLRDHLFQQSDDWFAELNAEAVESRDQIMEFSFSLADHIEREGNNSMGSRFFALAFRLGAFTVDAATTLLPDNNEDASIDVIRDRMVESSKIPGLAFAFMALEYLEDSRLVNELR